ncbi:dual specificity protein phosphatase 3-like isoform X2 [Amphibalanus amphitrite]|uniref:dual specificity protein phosphatase 3-like isoform X2 n=1 Tax=Amphibalanus amphitrite TaxID=1232801 RepID=UPI001C8FE4CC|nr:dual specificity protein phosphatase 3-like isoform X2 [Amphibalanus amphitrite]
MALTSRTAWRDIRSPLTVADLRAMLVAPSRGVIAFPSRPYDEVYPGIIIGDCWMATDPVILESLRVSAVLNAAQGIGQSHLVDTDSYFYERRRLPVKFLGLHAIDADWYRLEDWFQVAADFIHESRRSGKVLVHCVQGLSRSATLVIAYLMIKLHMSLSQALQTVRARREIFPNDGFLQQLIRLNNQLMDARRVNVSWL